MSKKKMPMVTIEDAEIGFKNFSGLEGQYNTKGNRNFSIFLTKEDADKLETAGWNVRWLKPRAEGEPQKPILPVKVAFGNYPPKIVLVSGNKQTLLDENMVNILDFTDIERVDVKLNPYEWNVQGKRGVKAYLKLMYAVMAVDEFAQKYEVEPDSGLTCILGPDGKCIE